MKCPKCNSSDHNVIDSRPTNKSNGIRRRRECVNCGFRFTSYEYLSLSPMLIIKRNGIREEFNREKLIRSIQAPCVKRPVSRRKIEEIAGEIEKEITSRGETEIQSSAIGEAVMLHLRVVDKVAYIRFASIYREFQDVTEFREEIESLEKITV